jgi:small subunit ribosomal protein S8
MFTDPIADMLTRIRNAQMVKKTEVILPYSKLKFNILTLIKQEGWVGDIEVMEPEEINKKTKSNDIAKFRRLKVGIFYQEDGQPKIKNIKRISKPGRRMYTTKEDLPKVLNGWGIAVISTSKGLMSNKQARKEGLGGEIICEIY